MESNKPPGCENCEEELTIHLTQIINNKIKKIDMCQNCPNAKSIEDPNQFNLLSDLVSKPFVGSDAEETMETCATCGYTEKMLKKTGRLGCADCYDTFEVTLKPMLAGMHNGQAHMGKVPSVYHRDLLVRQLEDLRETLNEKIEAEEYEEAINIRDQIKEIEERIGSQSPE